MGVRCKHIHLTWTVLTLHSICKTIQRPNYEFHSKLLPYTCHWCRTYQVSPSHLILVSVINCVFTAAYVSTEEQQIKRWRCPTYPRVSKRPKWWRHHSYLVTPEQPLIDKPVLVKEKESSHGAWSHPHLTPPLDAAQTFQQPRHQSESWHCHLFSFPVICLNHIRNTQCFLCLDL